MEKASYKTTRKPLFLALVSSLLLLLTGFFMLWQRYQILIDERESEMSAIIDVVGKNIDQSLKYSYSAALSLALQIDEQGNIDNFESVAAQLVDSNPNIDAVEIVPDGVITAVYPYEENKDALDYNILEDETRNKEAFKAIEKKRMFFAGPFQLRQGGLAIVGRLPVFIKDDFWGFSAILIKFDNLITQSGISDLAGDEYQFQFSKINPDSGEVEYFLEGNQDLDNSYSEAITLPDGEWTIYILPVNSLQPFYRLIPVAFLIIFLAGAFGWIVYYALKQPVILEQRVQEQAAKLAESDLRFRIIFHQAAIGMARVDSKNSTIIESNAKFQELLGYTEEELIGKCHRDFSHPDDIAYNSQLTDQLIANEVREYSLTKRLVKKNGEIIWIKLNVSPLWGEGEEASSHIALVEDISEKVKAEKLLKDNEKRFRSLVENSNEIILIIDTNNTVKYFSPSLAKISKYEEIDFSANGILFYIHPDDHEILRNKVELARENPGTPISDIIIRVKDAEDNWFWVNSTVTNMLNVAHVNGFVINLRDITEKREAELNLVKSYELVMEQNKRLLNFAYIVSHNLRSHASNMESILELYDSEESDAERSVYIELLHKVSKNLDQSLYDLNEVVSISTNIDLKVEKINIKNTVRQTLEMLSLQIKNKEGRVYNEVPAEMEVTFNSAYMESVLLNFITNALRYSSEERDPEIHIRGYKENEKWVLEVEDNGIGINLDKHQDKIFGLYKTFSGKKDARGVGLFITKNQIEAMGGSVEVFSEPGKGTTFKVIFK